MNVSYRRPGGGMILLAGGFVVANSPSEIRTREIGHTKKRGQRGAQTEKQVAFAAASIYGESAITSDPRSNHSV